MDIKALLEKLTQFSGEPEQKAGDQVRGSEKAKPNKDGKHPFLKRLVGDSKEFKQRALDEELEKRLLEKWQEFKDTVEHRPARKGSRHPRGHEPQQGYQVIQDENSEAEKRVQTKLKNIERLKTPISDEEWKRHQEKMKKDREEYVKKHPDSIYKEEDLTTVKEDPFGQWVLVDKKDGHIKQAFDDKQHAYNYWDHFKLSTKDFKIMHGSEYVDSDYEALAEYGATSTGSPTSGGDNAEQAKKVAQATSTIKSATGTPVSPANLAKAIDAVSQGKAVNQIDAKNIEPVMDIIKKTAEDPQLANQFKQLAQQAKRTN